MKYEVYYNVMGVLPVHAFFGTKEAAEAHMQKVRAKGFEPELKEL